MSKAQRVYGTNYHAGSHKKAKDRRGAHNFQRGKYKRQWARTEANRKRRQQKHLSLYPNDIQLLAKLKQQPLSQG